MSDVKLLRIADGSMKQRPGTSVAVEKSLQHLIEEHLEKLLGMWFGLVGACVSGLNSAAPPRFPAGTRPLRRSR